MTEFPDSLTPQIEERRLEQCEGCHEWFPFEEGGYQPEENTWVCAKCLGIWNNW